MCALQIFCIIIIIIITYSCNKHVWFPNYDEWNQSEFDLPRHATSLHGVCKRHIIGPHVKLPFSHTQHTAMDFTTVDSDSHVDVHLCHLSHQSEKNINYKIILSRLLAKPHQRDFQAWHCSTGHRFLHQRYLATPTTNRSPQPTPYWGISYILSQPPSLPLVNNWFSSVSTLSPLPSPLSPIWEGRTCIQEIRSWMRQNFLKLSNYQNFLFHLLQLVTCR